MIDNIYTWSKEASSYVRFKGDRDKVYQELVDHMSDKIEHLQAQGYDYEQAATLTMDEMGNLSEIGRHLGEIHKPYFGWLWRVSRWILLVVLIFFAFIMLNEGSFIKTFDYYNNPTSEFTEDVFNNSNDLSEFRQLPIDSEKSVRIGDYQFRLRRAVICKEDFNEDYSDEYVLYFTIHASFPFYVRSPQGIQFFMSAKDSNGNEYSRAADSTGPKAVLGNQDKLRFTSCDFEMWIDDIDKSAEWIDITYHRFNQEFQFRIPLSEVNE